MFSQDNLNSYEAGFKIYAREQELEQNGVVKRQEPVRHNLNAHNEI